MLTFLTSYLSAYSPDLGRLSSVDRGEGKGPVVWRPTVGVSGLPGEGYNELISLSNWEGATEWRVAEEVTV